MNTQRIPKLTTTSFALLGLLQRKPWSAYELTGFMRNSILRAVWPRAESHLYSEPKLLEKRGLVVSRQERNGARKRRVYRITEAGQAALSNWLHEQRESEYRFEYELLVRLALAEAVGIDVALAYLQQVREEVYRDARDALAAVEVELEDTTGMASRASAPWAGAIVQLIVGQLESRLAWADAMIQRFTRLQVDHEDEPSLAPGLYEDARDRLKEVLVSSRKIR